MSDALARGLALLDMNRAEAALEPLARAVAEDPEDAFAQRALAGALLDASRFEEAQAAARRLLQLAPDDAEGFVLLALACGELGQHRAAVQAAREAVRLAPESVRTLVVASQAELATGQVTAAADAARRATEVAPESPAAHHQSGLILLRYGHYEDAEVAFLKVLELEPESASAQNNLALARFARGDRAGALADLERAARNDPTMSAVHANLERYGISPIVVVLYALAVLALLAGVVWAGMAPGAGPAALLAAAVLAFPAIAQLERRTTRLSPASAARLDDARRGRRYRPWTWRWTRPLAVQAWWYERLGPGPRVLMFYGALGAIAVAVHAWVAVLILSARCVLAWNAISSPPPAHGDSDSEVDVDAAAREAWETRDRRTAARERALLGLRPRR